MKTKILITILVIMLTSWSEVNSQTGRATIYQINDGVNIDVSIYLKSTGGSTWALGFASFVFDFNNVAMDSAREFSESIWDNDSSSEYSDQIMTRYGIGNSASIEIGLDSFPSNGIIVPGDSTLVGTLRFNILDKTVNHNLRWNLIYSAVLDNNGNDITTGIIFSDPDNTLLPVELESFVSTVVKNTVNLSWTTSHEQNNSGFFIQRCATANHIENWKTIGFVRGNGNSIERINYKFTDFNLQSGSYAYRLKQTDFNGNTELYPLGNIVEIGIPMKYILSQNYPNPFNPTTRINYDIAVSGKVSLKIFDLSGKEVALLVNDYHEAGYYTVDFNAGNISSGVYLYSLNVNNFSSTKKMILIK